MCRSLLCLNQSRSKRQQGMTSCQVLLQCIITEQGLPFTLTFPFPSLAPGTALCRTTAGSKNQRARVPLYYLCSSNHPADNIDLSFVTFLEQCGLAGWGGLTACKLSAGGDKAGHGDQQPRAQVLGRVHLGGQPHLRQQAGRHAHVPLQASSFAHTVSSTSQHVRLLRQRSPASCCKGANQGPCRSKYA